MNSKIMIGRKEHINSFVFAILLGCPYTELMQVLNETLDHLSSTDRLILWKIISKINEKKEEPRTGILEFLTKRTQRYAAEIALGISELGVLKVDDDMPFGTSLSN